MERLKTHLAGRLPNDMMNHLICKGGKDQESLLGLIPFRAKFKRGSEISLGKCLYLSTIYTWRQAFLLVGRSFSALEDV